MAGAHPSASNALPSVHHLRAALRTARVIDAAGTRVVDARESYSHVASDGLYRHEDLVVGERVLLDAGLLREQEGVLYPVEGLSDLAMASVDDGSEAILTALLAARPPLWLGAATTNGHLLPELIPDGDREALDAAMGPGAREALLLQLGRRFNDDERRRVGELAEIHLVEQCRAELEDAGRSELATQVRRVSVTSDQLGYDVTAPTTHDTTRRLECKGTRGTREGSVRFFLSRNEAERALADPDWYLVVCRVSGDDSVETLGWCRGEILEPLLPDDPTGTRWASAEVSLGTEKLTAGLPPAT